MTDEDQSCYGCGAINGAYVIDIVLPNGERKNAPRAWVYPQTSRGEIGFCNNCFEDENFRDLLPKDVETISWYFAEFFVEGRPRRAMELLEPLLAKWGRVPDLKTFVSEHCSWCGLRIPRHDQIPLGAQLEMGSAENALVGCAVELDVEGYVVTGIMFPAESEAKKEGFDLSMIACSDECADQAMLHAGKASIKLRPLSEASVRLETHRA